ncbi:MAG: hypothetical protein R8G66_18185 [Cytophagales bacterium]|nr:hypothetical protein [Cytophagales bacterium]
MSARRQAQEMTDYQLMRVANGESSWLFGAPSENWRKTCIQELINRGFDESKFQLAHEKFEDRARLPLDLQGKITAFLIPADSLHETDIERFRKYGYKRQMKQYYIFKFSGVLFYVILVIILRIIYIPD